MFGFSFGELLVICVVALIAVGPKKLPGMLQTLGQWLRKIRNLTVEVRNQTGIDDLLRSEGLHGGLNELRGLLRGNHGVPFEAPAPQPAPRAPLEDPYVNIDIDVSREYPQEGADAHGALPDDLLQDDAPKQDSATETQADATAAPVTATAGPTESA
ncbi:MAG TPA: twin-arginine translocase TatA/TatE family subunit [Polyangiaceae bacterium]